MRALMSKNPPKEKPKLQVAASESSELAARLGAEIAAQFGPRDETPFSILAHSAEDALLGGVNGVIHWRWLYIRHLWVAETARGDGLGRQLIMAAEAQARVRDCINLRTGNLLDPSLFTGEAAYDFIFCRNLLIYFDRPTQVRVLERLKRQLHEGGTLFIGPAEASLASQSGLQAIGRQQTFAFRLAPPRPAPLVAQPSTSRLRPTPPPVARPVVAARPRPRPAARNPVRCI